MFYSCTRYSFQVFICKDGHVTVEFVIADFNRALIVKNRNKENSYQQNIKVFSINTTHRFIWVIHLSTISQ